MGEISLLNTNIPSTFLILQFEQASTELKIESVQLRTIHFKIESSLWLEVEDEYLDQPRMSLFHILLVNSQIFANCIQKHIFCIVRAGLTFIAMNYESSEKYKMILVVECEPQAEFSL